MRVVSLARGPRSAATLVGSSAVTADQAGGAPGGVGAGAAAASGLMLLPRPGAALRAATRALRACSTGGIKMAQLRQRTYNMNTCATKKVELMTDLYMLDVWQPRCRKRYSDGGCHTTISNSTSYKVVMPS